MPAFSLLWLSEPDHSQHETGPGSPTSLAAIKHTDDQTVIAKVVHCLQTQPFCGVLFTREPVEGAFGLHEARIDSPDAPDIVLAMRWNSDRSATGAPGLVDSDYSEYGPGCGMHGSLSPFDMHNACIAAGPDFRQGAQDDLPSGNIDIAPTVLRILGVEPQHKLSGRVLREALTQPGSTPPPCETRCLERRG